MESIQSYWEKLKTKSISNVEFARGILFVLFALQIINLMLTVFGDGVNYIMLLLAFVLYYSLYFFIKQDLSKDFDNLMSDEFSKSIDIESFNSNLKLMVDEILNVFKISKPIEYYISINNFDYSPHVFSRSKVHFLVLPLGFFKLLSDSPQEAKAILAHELSHIAQHDTDLTILIKIFLKYIFAIILPLQLIIISPSIYYSYVRSKELYKESDMYRNSMLVYGYNDPSSLEYYQSQAYQSYADARKEEREFWGLLVSIVIFFFLYKFLRQITYNSEKCADVGAATITNVPTIKAILERVSHDRKFRKRKSFWFTVNPSVDWRLAKSQWLEKRFE